MKIIKFKKKSLCSLYITNDYKKFIKISNKLKIIITDYNVYINFYNLIKEIKNYKFIIFPCGENFKNINTLKIIWKFLIKFFNKNISLLSIGGGVINDIVGFICSVYLRGINFIEIPTTLLCQIDSSIGGKNAINFFSKNTIGTIKNPIFIYLNYSIIFYMNKNDLKDGFAEIIKYFLLNNLKFLFYLYKIFNFKKILIRSCYIKIKIISQDYSEKSIRSVLNLGHTYAHCIENNKINKISHGKSVLIGIIFSLFVSTLYYKIDLFKIFKILNLFLIFKFKIINKIKFSDEMIKKIILDKKFNKKINFILFKKISCCTKKIIKKKNLLLLIIFFYEIKINNKMANKSSK
ncbi:3-dehydroquinate synthase [Candidatus Carsonella ruddii PV]|uniref:3-dehydroquinate synthase n=1 Tax=Carsonella ruddii (strain PV) TaxID=387662 RepID=Q05FW2_CARRP|nr:3-dehydroquinate synthase family protein [Candidatus Carsonella ruddii]BAF35059.1 3-dehydroquinate synthase [Candidatus Carsonella ruddii PV]